MTALGWELYGLNFDWLVVSTLILFISLFVFIFFRKDEHPRRIDMMAGDEGED
jgi:hypothetical protein